MESRQIKAAVAAYARAANLSSNNALILGIVRAGAAGRRPGAKGRAVPRIRAQPGRARCRVLRDLAQAQARLGNNGQASVLTAERYAMQGRLKDAKIHAERASDLLPRGSAAWQRAQDVLNAAEIAEKRE